MLLSTGPGTVCRHAAQDSSDQSNWVACSSNCFVCPNLSVAWYTSLPSPRSVKPPMQSSSSSRKPHKHRAGHSYPWPLLVMRRDDPSSRLPPRMSLEMEVITTRSRTRFSGRAPIELHTSHGNKEAAHFSIPYLRQATSRGQELTGCMKTARSLRQPESAQSVQDIADTFFLLNNDVTLSSTST